MQDEKVKRETQDLKQCQQNLNALGTLKTQITRLKQVFDNLMSRRFAIAGVRLSIDRCTATYV
ncbi:hypothetical protein AK51_06455 [Serratia nematodiphila DZ0503SBS1]|nr:hypothetical protein AK51_06455 [Serratia nematodiphila DZ0503SBS1]